MAKLKLIQHETMKRTVEQARKVDLGLPMSPFPDCDLCKEPGGLVTPEGMAFCGPCWRAHVEFLKSLNKLDEAEAGGLSSPIEEDE